MSSTIKRIALVAVAALTLGGLSGVAANAADEAVTGIAVSNVAYTTAASLTTPGTSAVPVTATVVAGTTINVGVATTGGAQTVKAFTDSSFSVAGTDPTVTETSITSGKNEAWVAPVAGTYYYTIYTGAGTKGYLALTTVSLGATTYDGKINGLGASTATGVAGVANTVTLKSVINASGGKAGMVTVSGAGSTIASATTGTISSDKLSVAIAASSLSTSTIVVNTPTAGTITANYYAETSAGSGIYSTTAAATVTITVNAASSSGVLSAANSTSVISAGTSYAPATAGVDDVVSVSKSAGDSATIRVTVKDSLAAALYSQTLTATITGPGLLGTPTANSGARATSSLGRGVSVTLDTTHNSADFAVLSDGTSGVATITIADGTTVLGTETVTFYGSVATLTATVVKGNVASTTAADYVAPTKFLSVVAKDSNGVAIPSLTTLTATSGSTSVLTVANPTWDSTDKVYYVAPTAVAVGSSVITVKDASGLISTTATLNVSKPVINTLALSLDSASYDPGALVTVTLKALDSNGAAVADGTYANTLAAALTASASVTGTIFGTSVTFKNGLATSTFYAPLIGGPLGVSGTTGASTSVLATAVQSVDISASATVNGGAAADAVDAANEATDAANAATDAANAAAEAADAATAAAQDAQAAVAALATQVASLIAGIKAQITTLTNLVIKIQKKVRA